MSIRTKRRETDFHCFVYLNYRIEELDEFAEKEDLEAMKHLKSDGEKTVTSNTTISNVELDNFESLVSNLILTF